jgi:hypothetical protein
VDAKSGDDRMIDPQKFPRPAWKSAIKKFPLIVKI